MGDKRLNVSVPADQLAAYDEEADEMGFKTRSAYIRSMINAGRREFELQPQGSSTEEHDSTTFLTDRVIQLLKNNPGMSQEEILDRIQHDLRKETADVIAALNDNGTIEYDLDADGLVVTHNDD